MVMRGDRKDAAMVADMREKCGPDFWLLMLDCWMSRDGRTMRLNWLTPVRHCLK